MQIFWVSLHKDNKWGMYTLYIWEVYELVSLWAYEFMSWWVCEVAILWSGDFVNWWVYQATSLQTTKQPCCTPITNHPAATKKRGVRNIPYTSFNIVAETRLEHVTSRLWAWRATNCSTPRCLLAPHFWIASAKVHIYPETHKLSANFLAKKNEFVNEKASFFAKQWP